MNLTDEARQYASQTRNYQIIRLVDQLCAAVEKLELRLGELEDQTWMARVGPLGGKNDAL